MLHYAGDIFGGNAPHGEYSLIHKDFFSAVIDPFGRYDHLDAHLRYLAYTVYELLLKLPEAFEARFSVERISFKLFRFESVINDQNPWTLDRARHLPVHPL